MLSSILYMPYCSPPRHLFATVLLADSGRTGSLCSPWPHYMSPLIFCQGSLCGWYVLDRPTFPWEQVLPSSIDTVQLTLSYIKTTDLLSSSTTFHGTIMSLSAWAKEALVASVKFFQCIPSWLYLQRRMRHMPVKAWNTANTLEFCTPSPAAISCTVV